MNNNDIKELKNKQIELLNLTDAICKKNNLTYLLIGGTLLGSIRHNGYIPWDDDIDIAMPQKDLDIFTNIINTQYNNKYFIQNSYTDKHFHFFFSKLLLNNTVLEQKNTYDYEQKTGINIDIFPLTESNGRTIILKIKKFLIVYISCHLIARNTKRRYLPQHIFTNIFSRNFLLRIRKKISNGNGDYLSNFGSKYPIDKQTFNKNVYFPLKHSLFEGKKYNIPNNYDFILKNIYGNKYMNIPPENKRNNHDIKKIIY